MQIYLNIFAVSDGIEEKQRFMNNSKWKQRKKVFFDRFPQIENRKTEKFVPPAEKQLLIPD